MNSRIVCLSCGFQFDISSRRARCPVCGTRAPAEPAVARHATPSSLIRAAVITLGVPAALFVSISILHIPTGLVAIVAVLIASSIVAALTGGRSRADEDPHYNARYDAPEVHIGGDFGGMGGGDAGGA